MKKKLILTALLILMFAPVFSAVSAKDKQRVGLYVRYYLTDKNQEEKIKKYDAMVSAIYSSLEYSYKKEFTNIILAGSEIQNKSRESRMNQIPWGKPELLTFMQQNMLDYALGFTVLISEDDTCKIMMNAYDKTATSIGHYSLKGAGKTDMSPDLLGDTYAAGLKFYHKIQNHARSFKILSAGQSQLVITNRISITNNGFIQTDNEDLLGEFAPRDLYIANSGQSVINPFSGEYLTSQSANHYLLPAGVGAVKIRSGFREDDQLYLLDLSQPGNLAIKTEKLRTANHIGFYGSYNFIFSFDGTGSYSIFQYSGGIMFSITHESRLTLGFDSRMSYINYSDDYFPSRYFYAGVIGGYNRRFLSLIDNTLTLDWFVKGSFYFSELGCAVQPGVELNLVDVFKLRAGLDVFPNWRKSSVGGFVGVEFSLPLYQKSQQLIPVQTDKK